MRLRGQHGACDKVFRKLGAGFRFYLSYLGTADQEDQALGLLWYQRGPKPRWLDHYMGAPPSLACRTASSISKSKYPEKAAEIGVEACVQVSMCKWMCECA